MEILSAVIGGFLAAGTGWFLQVRLEKSRTNRLLDLLTTGISDDLTNTIELMDRLAEDWERSQIVWFSTINEIVDSRHTYTHNKDWITLIGDDALRQKIARYYRRSANHLLQLQNNERRKYDIQAKFKALVQDLRIRHLELSEEEAKKQVTDNMGGEADELRYIDDILPTLVQGLERFKREARDILTSMREG